MSSAAWRIRKRVASLRADEWETWERLSALQTVLDIIDEELEVEAERQFTRPISQQAEQSRMLKEDK